MLHASQQRVGASRAFRSGKAPRLSLMRCRASAGQRDADAQAMSRRQSLASGLVLVAGALAMPAMADEVAAPAEPLAEVLSPTQVIVPGEIVAPPARPDVNVEMRELKDPILAYRFMYPVSTTDGKPLTMTMSRAPEKYSSAAPLTADARQRIVSELFDFKSFVGASMSVGPASGALKGRAPTEWKPREVALTVLVDRSTARTTVGQRLMLNTVEEAHLEERGGLQYWVYEHVSQGSPTITNRSRESYRHQLAVTSWRAGLDGTPYLYTLNLSCPEELWPSLEAPFRKAVQSFALLPTTRDYIPPDKDPWLFF
ncbi:hypothetical protein HYH03_005125 [Edaphochlamys debaryana]|uniref:PsbP C-terminal domain-containing protein n=1 Tax=Edaphochlamys debaryana TaxID=47281 RepID=A0A835Y5G0_9CHLO|nr:hypothetical protein HYH03_005125 [Edaphochlamys debaryana]|eukprot:KAG2496712.1 hypothetical protein HYH03_005125 [Edaphochlamys debaryana]